MLIIDVQDSLRRQVRDLTREVEFMKALDKLQTLPPERSLELQSKIEFTEKHIGAIEREIVSLKQTNTSN